MEKIFGALIGCLAAAAVWFFILWLIEKLKNR